MAPAPLYIIPVCLQPLLTLGTGSVSIHLTDTPSHMDPQAAWAIDFSAKLLFILLSEMMVTYRHLKRGKCVAGPWCTCVRMKVG